MEVYIVFVFILFLFSVYEVFYSNKEIKRYFLFLSFLGAVFIVGFRWETGTDWVPYKKAFEYASNWLYVVKRWGSELGYGTLTWGIRNLTRDYSWFLIVHAILFYGLLLRAFTKLTAYPNVAFMFYFASSLGIVGSNRQLIALVILLNGIAFLLHNEKVKYWISIALSFTMHVTSLLGVVYFFLNRYLPKKVIYLSIILAFFFGFSSLPVKLFGSFAQLGEYFTYKTEAYLKTADTALYGFSVMGVGKRAVFFIFFLYVRDKLVVKNGAYNILFNGYWFGLLMYLAFADSLSVMISRGSLYFNIMEGLLLSSVLVLIKQSVNRGMYLIVLLILSILLMYQSISVYPHIFDPYKGIWYNEFYYRIMT